MTELTAQWNTDRLGCITSSNVAKLIGKDPDKFTDGAMLYLFDRVAEIMTGEHRSIENLYSIEWGNKYEPEAIELLRKEFPKLWYYGKDNPKFFKISQLSGGSPDAIGEIGNIIFEIKCPENPANHVRYKGIKDGKALLKEEKDYFYQIHMNMLAVATETGIDYMDTSGVFVSYYPNCLNESDKLHIVHISPDKEVKELLEKVLAKSEKELLNIIKTRLS